MHRSTVMLLVSMGLMLGGCQLIATFDPNRLDSGRVDAGARDVISTDARDSQTADANDASTSDTPDVMDATTPADGNGADASDAGNNDASLDAEL